MNTTPKAYTLAERLTLAAAPRTLARVRLAISSAKGARRHAEHDDSRAERRKGAHDAR